VSLYFSGLNRFSSGIVALSVSQSINLSIQLLNKQKFFANPTETRASIVSAERPCYREKEHFKMCGDAGERMCAGFSFFGGLFMVSPANCLFVCALHAAPLIDSVAGSIQDCHRVLLFWYDI
jgi:hypothetical protein